MVKDFPIIRDTLIIDSELQLYYDAFVGAGPMFILARNIQFKEGFTLKLEKNDLVIVADVFDGTGGAIDGGGALKSAPAQRGRDGVGGKDAKLVSVSGYQRASGPGGFGTSGTDGGSGSSGSGITVLCRAALNVNLSSLGTAGADGGNAGNGGQGADGWYGTDDGSGHQPANAFAGSAGGAGGHGGNGGNGGSGGAIVFTTIADVVSRTFTSAGASAGKGGGGGRFGRDGTLCEQPACPPDAGGPCWGTHGADGTPGASPQPSYTVVTKEEYLSQVFAILGPHNYTNYWAPFRLEMGEYFFRRFRPAINDGADYGVLAAREFDAVLELQYNNQEAARLQQLLVGTPVTNATSKAISYLGGGSNVLGLPRQLDLLPRFQDYINAFTSFTPLVQQVFSLGVADILDAGQLAAVKTLIEAQQGIAMNALQDTLADLAIAKTEMKQATDETDYLQQQLEQATADLQAALATMTQGFSLEGIIGTVAEIGTAIVSVVAAIPTAGASLVALVPSVIALSSSVLANATPLVEKLFQGEPSDIKEVNDAYAKVNKQVTAVIAGGKAIVNFVKVVNKLSAGTTPDNSASVALVKRGADLTHQVLLAGNHVTLTQQRIDALAAKQGRTQDFIAWANGKKASLQIDEILNAGFNLIQMAQLRVDTLLSFAFLAQRSAEIYTLNDESANLYLDAGYVSPDLTRRYIDGFISAKVLMTDIVASWARLLQPIQMQKDFFDYFVRFGSDQAIFRQSLNTPAQLQLLRDNKPVPFRVELSQLGLDTREAKVRGVAIALVGASSPSSIATVEVRHGARYEQLLANPAPGQDSVFTQILEPQVTSVSAPNKPLMLDGVQFGSDPTPDTPLFPAIWGRGIAGDWEVRLPTMQPGGETIDLSALTEIQVWIGYQFLHSS